MATLYKGINHQLINAIYERLYSLFTEGQDQHIRIQAHAELRSVSRGEGDLYNLEFYHNAMHKIFATAAGSVILATGYTSRVPGFWGSLESIIKRNDDGSFQTDGTTRWTMITGSLSRMLSCIHMVLTRPTWDWALIEMR